MNLGIFAVAILIFCITVGAYLLSIYKAGEAGWEWLCVIVPILFSFGFTIMAVYLLRLGGYV